MLAKDSTLKDLAQEELADFQIRRQALTQQIQEIIKSGQKEEKFPNEIILESICAFAILSN